MPAGGCSGVGSCVVLLVTEGVGVVAAAAVVMLECRFRSIDLWRPCRPHRPGMAADCNERSVFVCDGELLLAVAGVAVGNMM